jgi:DNA-directed RNA polymerase specialized sigma subunit
METTTKKRTPRSTDSAHYVNNEEFLAALIEHKNNIKKAKEEGLEKPRVSNYLGDCFLKIATHLSYKGNFVGYSYRDDMISDGIENCLVAADKFDPEKSSNPFAYYTQIIYFAFVRRIQKEKKQQATKYKMLENIDIDQIIAHSEDNQEFANHLIELIRKQVDAVDEGRR